jgi:predicted DNA-binding ribbon-helix-helix protein
MCEFFVKADPIQYEQRSRTVRIHGVLTSIRLENMAWDTLAEMAEEEGRTTNALIALFHDEILAHRGEVPNFASFLRVTCMRYLRRRLVAAERALQETPATTTATPARAPVHALPMPARADAAAVRGSRTS